MQIGAFITGVSKNAEMEAGVANNLAVINMPGVSFLADYRFYKNDMKKTEGLYFAPVLNGNFRFLEISEYEYQFNNKPQGNYYNYGIGGLVGFQTIYAERFIFDFFLGRGINNNIINVHLKSNDPELDFYGMEGRYDSYTEYMEGMLGFAPFKRFVKNIDDHATENSYDLRNYFIFPFIKMGFLLGCRF